MLMLVYTRFIVVFNEFGSTVAGKEREGQQPWFSQAGAMSNQIEIDSDNKRT
jgi:hypothetical protein